MRTYWDGGFGSANWPSIFMNDFARLNGMHRKLVTALNRFNQLECLPREFNGLACS
jgi:hypothetical protein